MNRTLRATLLTLAGFALLTACGASNTSAVPQGMEVQSRVHKASGSSGDLLDVLIVAPPTRKQRLRAFTFPGLQQVSNPRIKFTRGLCSDFDGNIFVPQDEAIDEYAHGGKQPIETLSDTGFRGFSCAVDNTTGNLAVTNSSGQQSIPGNIVVYKGAKGSPISYTDSQMLNYNFCGYDDSGNLFITGVTKQQHNVLVELPKGTDSFINITLDKGIYPGAVQWDGNYLVVPGTANILYRVQVSGSTGTVVGTITLNHVPPRGTNAFWINGNEIAATYLSKVGLWPYPDGGEPTKLLYIRGHQAYGVTVSVAPSK